MPERAEDTPPDLPVDPDIDAAEERGRGRLPRLERRILAVVLTGGVAGGLARYALTSAWPTPVGGFPWATFAVNTAGAFTLALLLVLLTRTRSPHRYARPLLGTGFLGAFTTFSSVATATDQLAAHGHALTAVVYVAGSVLAALVAVSFGVLLGRSLGSAHHQDRGTPTDTPRGGR